MESVPGGEAFWPASAPLPHADPTLDPRESRARARELIYQATEEIPMEQKAAYLEARERAPFLFENESDPYRFLLTCDFNVWQAAERMIKYWEVRKNVFGPYRAFLPLTLTGDGALTKEDILCLQAGFPAFLPHTASGQCIVFCDRRHQLAISNPERRLRVMFYLCRVHSDDERAIQKGVLVLLLLVTPQLLDLNLSAMRRNVDVCWNVMPFKVAHWHVLNCPPKNCVKAAKQYKIQDLVVSYVSCFADQANFRNIDVHFEREPGDIFNFLHDHLGMLPDSIPRTFGGTWDFTQAISWCRTQALGERVTYKLILKAANRTKPVALLQDPSKPDKAAKRRAHNAMHSKLKRERRLQEARNLTSEHNQLQQQNLDLKAEYVRLEDLLKQAEEMLSCLRNSTNPPNQLLRTERTHLRTPTECTSIADLFTQNPV